MYELKKAVTESGWLSDSKVKVPCTKTLVIANTDAGDDMLETASTVLLKNLSRVLGTNGNNHAARRLCFWVLFTIALLVAWRLAGLLLDLVLLVVIVVALILR